MLGETDSKDGGWWCCRHRRRRFLLNLEIHPNRILFNANTRLESPSTFPSLILKQYSVRRRKAVLKNKKIFEPSYKKVH